MRGRTVSQFKRPDQEYAFITSSPAIASILASGLTANVEQVTAQRRTTELAHTQYLNPEWYPKKFDRSVGRGSGTIFYYIPTVAHPDTAIRDLMVDDIIGALKPSKELVCLSEAMFVYRRHRKRDEFGADGVGQFNETDQTAFDDAATVFDTKGLLKFSDKTFSSRDANIARTPMPGAADQVHNILIPSLEPEPEPGVSAASIQIINTTMGHDFFGYIRDIHRLGKKHTDMAQVFDKIGKEKVLDFGNLFSRHFTNSKDPNSDEMKEIKRKVFRLIDDYPLMFGIFDFFDRQSLRRTDEELQKTINGWYVFNNLARALSHINSSIETVALPCLNNTIAQREQTPSEYIEKLRIGIDSYVHGERIQGHHGGGGQNHGD